MSNIEKHKFRNLFLGLLFDAMGMVSFLIPGIGEFSDIIWAPISGWLMTRLYKGNIGRAAGVFAFLEELIPGLDFIPSFTLMWFYNYVIKTPRKEKAIEV